MPFMALDDALDLGDALGLGRLVLALLHGGLYRLALGFEGLDLLFQLVDHAAQEIACLCLGLFLWVEFR